MPSNYPALLDHLVWLAGDLDAACAEFEAMSGITPRYGGRHPTGTHNAIVALGPRVYLEIAAPVPGAEAGHPWVDAARRRPEPHLYAYCMRTSGTLAALADQVKAAGFQSFGPSAGNRTLPDGTLLEWELFIPIIPGANGAIPFHIDWLDTSHPATRSSIDVKLTSFSIEHPDPQSIQHSMALLAPGVDLRRGKNKVRMTATLDTPIGLATLSS
ncbi:MAG: VOC family protein [Pseudomonadota bacterium]